MLYRLLVAIFLLFTLSNCSPKKSGMETCFERIKNNIGSDSILSQLKSSPLDSSYNYKDLIGDFVLEDSICRLAIDSYMRANSSNRLGINNFVLFQQFQAYLNKKDFNRLEAELKSYKFMDSMNRRNW